MASYPMNKKRKNFSKLSRAIIDLCTETLRVTLDSNTKPQAIANKLSKIPNQPKRSAREMSLIKDASKVGSYKDFDISLLYQILRCVCNHDIRNYLSKQINPGQLQNNSAFMADLTPDELKKVQQITNTGLYGGCNDDLLHKLYMHFRHSQSQLIHPSKGWGKKPDPNDTELGDNIERIREIRNSLYGHISSTEVSDTDFESHWNHLIAIMSGMNTHLQQSRGNKDFKNDLDGIKSSSMDEEMEQFYIDEIGRLAKYEEDLTKRMDEVGEEVTHMKGRIQMAESKQMMLQTEQEELEEGVHGLHNQISNLYTKVQKTVDSTKDLEGALETVQGDVAIIKEHAEVRRKNPRRRKMTAT